MRGPLIGVFVIMCSAAAADAATMGEVDALIRQANGALRSTGGDRVGALREAIDRCKRALELLGEVEGISEEARDSKSADILSTLYWCRKMLPLDLAGNQKIGAAKGKADKPKRGQEEPAGGADAPAPAKKKTKEYDKDAFESVKGYATRRPEDIEGILIRYEGVAASYPKTKWGEKARKEAENTRKKLSKARESVLSARRDQIERLQFDEALAAIAKDLASPRMKGHRAQLEQLANDVRALQRLKAKVVNALKLSRVRMEEPLDTLGVDKQGWVIAGGEDGVDVVLESKTAPRTKWSWADLGARAMVRLGGRFVRGNNAQWTELVAVGATVTEDYVLAHDLFGKLLVLAPERVTDLTGYFERATSGYRSSGEGRVAIRMGEAKKLVKRRKFEEAFALINQVREDLASSSTMVEKLHEVNSYRRKLMLQSKLNDLGKPLSPFEKQVRSVFGGDVKLDEETGKIEVLYDFSNVRQLRDFEIAYRYGQWKKSSRGFQVAKGQLFALGKRLNVYWRFPIEDVDIQVDATYYDEGGRFELSVHNNDERYDLSTGGFADGEAGYVSMFSRRLYSYGFYRSERPPMIWRVGETATLRVKASDMGSDYFDLFFNGDYVGYTYSYSDAPRPGGVGFGFNGGKGAIDNVTIRGELDMQWFKDFVSRPRRRL